MQKLSKQQLHLVAGGDDKSVLTSGSIFAAGSGYWMTVQTTTALSGGPLLAEYTVASAPGLTLWGGGIFALTTLAMNTAPGEAVSTFLADEISAELTPGPVFKMSMMKKAYNIQ